jgi:hypothetical protein
MAWQSEIWGELTDLKLHRNPPNSGNKLYFMLLYLKVNVYINILLDI